MLQNSPYDAQIMLHKSTLCSSYLTSYLQILLVFEHLVSLQHEISQKCKILFIFGNLLFVGTF